MTSARKASDRAPKRAERSTDFASEAVSQIGRRIRELRVMRQITLQQLGEMTNLTPSMLSLVERGKVSPSIGSLIAIAHALGAAITDLVMLPSDDESEVVIRWGSQPVVETAEKLLRSILRQDRRHGLLISVADYRPSTGSSVLPRAHEGFEHGFVLEGELTVELEGKSYKVGPRDLISYRSTKLHRIWNYGDVTATALWFNLQDQDD